MKLSVHLFLTDILPEKRRLFHKVVKNRIFGKSSAKEVFSKMRSAGIEGVEVLIPNFATEQDIEDLKHILYANKMKIYSVHQAWRFVTKTQIREIEKLFEIGKTLSSEVVVLHINSAKKQVLDKTYISKIHSLQEKYGIKAGFENMEKHAGSILNKSIWHEVQFASIMKQNNFCITLDVCHLGQSGGDIIKFARQNLDNIVNIHMSDYRKHYLNNSLRPMRYKHMPLGKGQLPINEFLQVLKQKSYSGLLTLEIETDLEGLLDSAQIVRLAS